jgi:hypothetical protein
MPGGGRYDFDTVPTERSEFQGLSIEGIDELAILSFSRSSTSPYPVKEPETMIERRKRQNRKEDRQLVRSAMERYFFEIE